MKLLILAILIISVDVDAWVEVEKRMFAVNQYPCMKCHKHFKNNKINLPLQKPHENIQMTHFMGASNCFLCHDKNNRNQLVLISKEKVGFDESYKTCTQCHGEKLREWRKNIHGKQIGSWKIGNNTTTYKLSCLSCHDAHIPKIKKMKTMPPPPNPYLLRGRKNILKIFDNKKSQGKHHD